jgi:hypothetical protein
MVDTGPFKRFSPKRFFSFWWDADKLSSTAKESYTAA